MGRMSILLIISERTELPQILTVRRQLNIVRQKRRWDATGKRLRSPGQINSHGRAIIILEELNARQFSIDERFVRQVPVELRAVPEWDADQSVANHFDITALGDA